MYKFIVTFDIRDLGIKDAYNLNLWNSAYMHNW